MASPFSLRALARQYGVQIMSEGLRRYRVAALIGCSEKTARTLLAFLAQHPDPATWGDPDEPEPAQDAPDDGEQHVAEHGVGDNRTLEGRGKRIKTVDELLAACKVDPTQWEVVDAVVNKYELGRKDKSSEVIFEDGKPKGYARDTGKVYVEELFQVKVKLRRRVDTLNLLALKADVLAEIRAAAPVYTPRARPSGSNLLYLAMHDLHVGKLARAIETGEDYSLELARDLAIDLTARLLERAGRERVERIVVPIGQDLSHIENDRYETTRGTGPLDAAARVRVVRRFAYQTMVRVLELCAEVAPVDGEAVAGNHGRETDLAIAERLEARFENHPHISIRVPLTPRSYYQYGVNLLGLAHGDEMRPQDLPLVMADEMPEAWARTETREWLLGHVHKKKRIDMVAEDEYRGVRVRHLPSISALDWWHAASGYRNVRAMEAYLYHREDGYAGHLAERVRRAS